VPDTFGKVMTVPVPAAAGAVNCTLPEVEPFKVTLFKVGVPWFCAKAGLTMKIDKTPAASNLYILCSL
jgi:hypothetical protein